MTDTLSLIEIPLDEFMKAPKLGLEVYLKLTETSPSGTPYGRYVKLAHGADDLDVERVKELKSRGIDRLYLNLEDLDRYINYERTILRAATQSHKLDPRKKLNLIRTTLNHILRRVFSSATSPIPFSALQDSLFNSLEMLQSLPRGDRLIDCLDTLPDDLYNHASLNSIISLLVARELNWASPIVLQKVALAGLFHDLGMKSLPESARCTHPGFLDYQGRIIYNTHPEKSAQLLGQVEGISTDVLLSVQQHHERLDGSGFPKGLSSGNIQPLALLVGTVDLFLEEYYLLESRSRLRIEAILRGIAENKSNALPGDVILALCRVFQVELDDKLIHALVRGGLNIGSR